MALENSNIIPNPVENRRILEADLTKGDQQILESLCDIVLEPQTEIGNIKNRINVLAALSNAQYSPTGNLPAKSHIAELVIARSLKNKNLQIIAQNQKALEIFYNQYNIICRLDRITRRRESTIRSLDRENFFQKRDLTDSREETKNLKKRLEEENKVLKECLEICGTGGEEKYKELEGKYKEKCALAKSLNVAKAKAKCEFTRDSNILGKKLDEQNVQLENNHRDNMELTILVECQVQKLKDVKSQLAKVLSEKEDLLESSARGLWKHVDTPIFMELNHLIEIYQLKQDELMSSLAAVKSSLEEAHITINRQEEEIKKVAESLPNHDEEITLLRASLDVADSTNKDLNTDLLILRQRISQDTSSSQAALRSDPSYMSSGSHADISSYIFQVLEGTPNPEGGILTTIDINKKMLTPKIILPIFRSIDAKCINLYQTSPFKRFMDTETKLIYHIMERKLIKTSRECIRCGKIIFPSIAPATKKPFRALLTDIKGTPLRQEIFCGSHLEQADSSFVEFV